MADNATYNNKSSGIPSGTTIRADDVDDTLYQIVKIDVGGDGVSVPVTDLASSADLTSLLTELKLKADLTETQPVSAASLPIPTGAATAVKQQPPVITAAVYNVTLTSADTEYSQALTANTREFRFRCRTWFPVRYAFVTGKVATPTTPWLTLPAGSDYWADNANLAATTLYLAADEAGVIVEIEEWV